jgi:alkaline phosphatase D
MGFVGIKKHFDTPNLNIVATKSMKPSYPTKKGSESLYYSNGFVTRSRHTIINFFYDPEVFSLGSNSKTDARFLGGSPIWNVCKVSELLRFTSWVLILGEKPKYL